MRAKYGLILLGGLALLCGCTSHDIVTTAARPGKFASYNCDQLNRQGLELVARERELQELMRRAEQGPGGALASTLAYKTDYAMVQGDLREIEISAVDKKCPITHRAVSEGVVR